MAVKASSICAWFAAISLAVIVASLDVAATNVSISVNRVPISSIEPSITLSMESVRRLLEIAAVTAVSSVLSDVNATNPAGSSLAALILYPVANCCIVVA